MCFSTQTCGTPDVGVPALLKVTAWEKKKRDNNCMPLLCIVWHQFSEQVLRFSGSLILVSLLIYQIGTLVKSS